MAANTGSIFWWCSDMLCISGFVDDVIFAHKLRLLNVTARLKLTDSLGLGYKRRIGIPVAGSGCSGLLLVVRAY